MKTPQIPPLSGMTPLGITPEKRTIADYYGTALNHGQHGIVAVIVHKRNGKFSHTTQRFTGEVFNTPAAALRRVAVLNKVATAG